MSSNLNNDSLPTLLTKNERCIEKHTKSGDTYLTPPQKCIMGRDKR